MRKDIYKEAEALIDNILYVNENTIARAEATCDADLMAYARAAEYYLELIAKCICLCGHHSGVMDMKIKNEKDDARNGIETRADVHAAEDADKMWAERHNNTVTTAKRHINYVLALCSRESSPLRDLTDDMRQLERYTGRMQKDLAEKRDKLKKLRMKRIEGR